MSISLTKKKRVELLSAEWKKDTDPSSENNMYVDFQSTGRQGYLVAYVYVPHGATKGIAEMDDGKIEELQLSYFRIV